MGGDINQELGIQLHCPKLKELPSPPFGKNGWPWTEDSESKLRGKLDGNNCPRISIVTPSLNQGKYIEKTIRSILLQDYPDIEYIIIDGGSTDDTVNIIKKYGKWLKYWESKRDRGQAHAINKGFKMSTGKLLAWLNSDDIYMKDALFHIAGEYVREPYDMLFGPWIIEDEGGLKEGKTFFPKNIDLNPHLFFWDKRIRWGQCSIFFTYRMLKDGVLLDEKLFIAMDYDLIGRLLAMSYRVTILRNSPLSKSLRHKNAKTIAHSNRTFIELVNVSKRYIGKLDWNEQKKYQLERMLFIFRRIKALIIKKKCMEALEYLKLIFKSEKIITMRAFRSIIKEKTKGWF